MTTIQDAYDVWRKEGRKAETFDQAMYILFNEITKRSLLEQVPEEVCDDKLDDFSLLQMSFQEFLIDKYGLALSDLKCHGIDTMLMTFYKMFLQLKDHRNNENDNMEIGNLMTLGEVLYLLDKSKIADIDPKMLQKFGCYSPLLS